MKNNAAIVLLFAFLFTQTEVSQFFRVPTLLCHYWEHVQEDGENSLWDYLSLHYSGSAAHIQTHNHREHDNLPFKADDCSVAHLPISSTPPQPFSLTFPSMSNAKPLSGQQHIFYLSAYHGNIWQPPKVA